MPRQAEQADFAAAMEATPPAPETSKFAAARDYFRQQAMSFLTDAEVPADPYASGSESDAQASLLAATVLGLVKLVVIDLGMSTTRK